MRLLKLTKLIFGMKKMEASEKRRLLDADSASIYLSISRSKLYEWHRAGKIPSIRIDGKRLFDIYELDEFVEKLKFDQRNIG